VNRSLLELLVHRFPERERKELHAFVMCGEILVDGARIRNPKQPVNPNADVRIVSEPYVSRGGRKLEAALEAWGIDVTGLGFLDAGASTGGFTDCLLQRGAAFVHAVDVGFGQLHPVLRRDPRVHVHERTNIMAIDVLEPKPHAAVADLSFRSIAGAAAKMLELVSDALLLALVKPQFEWDDPDPSFDGVVPAHAVRGILEDTARRLLAEGCPPVAATAAAITGRKGNQEYIFRIEPGGELEFKSFLTDLETLFA
jgi:23S rRNA (cytidine1920-2'-O)/16S rRNA (cytidine1409-2'-O)-methyltransferase